jgi:hypothetical protein
VSAEYRAMYDMAAARLRNGAKVLDKVLHPCDVYGLFFAVGIERMLLHESDADAAKWLRELADSIEAHEGASDGSRLTQ